MEKAFDRVQLNKLDRATKNMVDTQYNFCITNCNLTFDNPASCKQNCYKDILVPYKIMLHQSMDSEEHLYRQCLANKFPSVKPEDYVECSKGLHAQRVEMLSTHLADTCQNLLSQMHSAN